jgi:hypothetical protein
MRKNAFGDFFGFPSRSPADGFNHIRRDFFQRLDIEIATNILDYAVKTVWHFHKQQPNDCKG